MNKEKFLENIGLPDPETECMKWLGAVSTQGYGNVLWNYKYQRVHRVSWEIEHNEPISKDLLCLHKCDNKLCINPQHLFLGTHLDNVKDRNRKNRQAQGEIINTSKLTVKEVLRIRHIYFQNNYSLKEIGKWHSVTATTIYCIVNRKSWKHI